MLQLTVNGKKTFSASVADGEAALDGVSAQWDVQWLPSGLVSILYNGRSYTAMVEGVDRKNKEVTVRINGQVHKVEVKEPIDQLLTNLGMDSRLAKKAEPVRAPMPGMVLKILVAEGQQIQKGDGLVVLEAMKMENILKATGPATVKSIKVEERKAVEKGAVLIELQ